MAHTIDWRGLTKARSRDGFVKPSHLNLVRQTKSELMGSWNTNVLNSILSRGGAVCRRCRKAAERIILDRKNRFQFLLDYIVGLSASCFERLFPSRPHMRSKSDIQNSLTVYSSAVHFVFQIDHRRSAVLPGDARAGCPARNYFVLKNRREVMHGVDMHGGRVGP